MQSNVSSPCVSPCVLLTATIRVREDMCFTVRADATLRAEDYRRSFVKWLTVPGVERIVFVENSGCDLSEFVEIARRYSHKRVECLSFLCPPYPGHRGKGYGEAFIVDYALQNSELISESRHLIKASGRYYVRNIETLIAFVKANPELQAICNLQRHLTWADSRVFCGSRDFVAGYLLPFSEIIDDTQGVCFENALARAVHRLMSEGGRWSMLPRAPEIEGVHATNNRAYSVNPIRVALRQGMHWARCQLLGGPYLSSRRIGMSGVGGQK